MGNPWLACQMWHADELFIVHETSPCQIYFQFLGDTFQRRGQKHAIIFFIQRDLRNHLLIKYQDIKQYVLKKFWFARGKSLCQRFGQFWHALSKR